MVVSVAHGQSESFHRWAWRRPLLYTDEYVWLSVAAVLVLLTFLAAAYAGAPAGPAGFVLHLCIRAMLPCAVLALAEHVGRRQPRFGRRLVYAGIAALTAVLTADIIMLCCA